MHVALRGRKEHEHWVLNSTGRYQQKELKKTKILRQESALKYRLWERTSQI